MDMKGFVLIVFARDTLMPALRKVIFKVRQTLHKPVLMQENYTLYGVSVSRKKLHRLPFSWRVMALLLLQDLLTLWMEDWDQAYLQSNGFLIKKLHQA